MCGITGRVYHDPQRSVEPHILTAMCESLRHRGPDEAGSYLRGNVGFGMRRLSIIDLGGGKQPIQNEARTVGTVFNGEIYNFVELRQSLQAHGHHFYTYTDGEVIVHLYEEYGVDFPRHLADKSRNLWALLMFGVWLGRYAHQIHDVQVQN